MISNKNATTGALFQKLYLSTLQGNKIGQICTLFALQRQSHQNIAISTKFSHFVGALVPISFTDVGQMWQKTVDPWSTLTRQISFECVIVLSSRDNKPQYLMVPVPSPLYR